jgi:hypothetical protein
MELFKSIRLKIGAIILREKAAKIKRRMVYNNFNLVKSIGIVWNAANKQEFQSLSKFQQQMNERNIEVQIIGYYDGKNLPDKYTAIRYLSCIRNYEVNWLYIPKSDDTQAFINKKFDVLIDVNFDKIFTLRYITILSNALFKVGLSEPENNSSPFDLIMEIKKPVSVENYLKQIVQYLEMMNS